MLYKLEPAEAEAQVYSRGLDTLLAAKQRLAGAKSNHETATRKLTQMGNDCQAAWETHGRVRRGNGRRVRELYLKERKAKRRRSREYSRHALSTQHGDEGAAARSRQLADRYAEAALDINVKRIQLEAETRKAFEAAIQLRNTVRRLRQTVEQTAAELRAAELACKAFLVREPSFRQFADETRESYEARQIFLQARRRRFIDEIGIPEEYREEVRVSEDSNGDVSFYFGGTEAYNDTDHAHYILFASGKPPLKRPPGRGRLF